MLDTIVPSPAFARVPPHIDGYLITFRQPSGRPAHDHFVELVDAVHDFDNPIAGWTAIAIQPARGGIPVGGPLTDAEIAAARRVA